MNKKILLTLIHDFLILCISFFLALWIRLDFGLTYNLMTNLWIFSIFFSLSNILILKYFGLYLGIWRYASINEIISIFDYYGVDINLKNLIHVEDISKKTNNSITVRLRDSVYIYFSKTQNITPSKSFYININ